MALVDGLKRKFVLMHVSGIPVRADARWVFVLVLMTAVVTANISQFTSDVVAAGVFGLAATFVFFVSIFLHEFAHAAIARVEGLSVIDIVLHPFGGLTRFRSEPESPRAEFRIAVAGPAASFVLAVIFAFLATVATWARAEILVVFAATLSIGNFLLAVFNLFPGYPLDGGRVLRAYLWRSGRDLAEATMLTGRCGQAIAGLMIIFGLFGGVLRGDFFTGFWAILVGVFLWDSASGIIRDVNRQIRTSVENAMMLPTPINPAMTIQEIIDSVLPMHRQVIFPVTEDRRLLGVLALEDIRSIERGRWRNVRAAEIMRPVESDHFVAVGSPLSDARELALSNDLGRVYVINGDGRLVGVIHGPRSAG